MKNGILQLIGITILLVLLLGGPSVRCYCDQCVYTANKKESVSK